MWITYTITLSTTSHQHYYFCHYNHHQSSRSSHETTIVSCSSLYIPSLSPLLPVLLITFTIAVQSLLPTTSTFTTNTTSNFYKHYHQPLHILRSSQPLSSHESLHINHLHCSQQSLPYDKLFSPSHIHKCFIFLIK